MVHKGYAIKVILFSNQNSKNMNIIKRFARWVLREDWEIASTRIKTLQKDLCEKNKRIDDLQSKLNDWVIKSHLNESSVLSLKRNKLNYNMLGVNSEIETYYWDFNFSNIKIISDDVFDLISEFIVAQRNVLTEL